MALNKLKTGVAFSSQIPEQNVNIEKIDNFMSAAEWRVENLTLAENILSTTSGTVQVAIFNGFAILKGAISNRTSDELPIGSVMATLPTGARPSNTLIVSGVSVNTIVQFRIMTTGEIVVYAPLGVNQWVSLTGITYIL